MNATYRNILAAAVHEAGHVVMYSYFGFPVDSVRIGDDGSGETAGRYPQQFDTTLIDLAGIAAERLAGFSDPPSDRLCYDTDYLATAELILSANWDAVVCLAEALLIRRRLTGAQVAALLAERSKHDSQQDRVEPSQAQAQRGHQARQGP